MPIEGGLYGLRLYHEMAGAGRRRHRRHWSDASQCLAPGCTSVLCCCPSWSCCPPTHVVDPAPKSWCFLLSVMFGSINQSEICHGNSNSQLAISTTKHSNGLIIMRLIIITGLWKLDSRLNIEETSVDQLVKHKLETRSKGD